MHCSFLYPFIFPTDLQRKPLLIFPTDFSMNTMHDSLLSVADVFLTGEQQLVCNVTKIYHSQNRKQSILSEVKNMAKMLFIMGRRTLKHQVAL